MFKEERLELVRTSLAAEDMNLPLQGLTLFPAFPVNGAHSSIVTVRGARGKPKYVKGNFPTLQLRRSAMLYPSSLSIPIDSISHL